MAQPDETIITITDITRAGFCSTGARRLFAAYGHDFRAFLKNGMSASEMLETGDAYAERVVRAKLGARA